MSNYADDNSPYESGFIIEEVIVKLEEDAKHTNKLVYRKLLKTKSRKIFF